MWRSAGQRLVPMQDVLSLGSQPSRSAVHGGCAADSGTPPDGGTTPPTSVPVAYLPPDHAFSQGDVVIKQELCGGEPTTEPGASPRAAAGSASPACPPSPELPPRHQPVDTRIFEVLNRSRQRMLSAVDIRNLLLASQPFTTDRPEIGTPDWAVYKECPKHKRRAKKSDRWANSGGMKGSRDLPYNSERPFVRRRYGSVFAHGDPTAKGKRYYEYTLLRQDEKGETYEDKSATLFHILPSPGETDRGRRAMLAAKSAANPPPREASRTSREVREGPLQQLVRPVGVAHPPLAQQPLLLPGPLLPAAQRPQPIQAEENAEPAAGDGLELLHAVAALRTLGGAFPSQPAVNWT